MVIMGWGTSALYKYYIILARLMESKAFEKSRKAAKMGYFFLLVYSQINALNTKAACAVLRPLMNPNYSAKTNFLYYNWSIILVSSNLLKHKFILEFKVMGLNSSKWTDVAFLGIIIKRLWCQLEGVLP